VITLKYSVPLKVFSFFQNPGFDFSHAKLSKCYDNVPGWSADAMKRNDEPATEKKT